MTTTSTTKTIEKLAIELIDLDHEIEAAEEIRNRLENELDQQLIKVALLKNKRNNKRREIRDREEGGIV